MATNCVSLGRLSQVRWWSSGGCKPRLSLAEAARCATAAQAAGYAASHVLLAADAAVVHVFALPGQRPPQLPPYMHEGHAQLLPQPGTSPSSPSAAAGTGHQGVQPDSQPQAFAALLKGLRALLHVTLGNAGFVPLGRFYALPAASTGRYSLGLAVSVAVQGGDELTLRTRTVGHRWTPLSAGHALATNHERNANQEPPALLAPLGFAVIPDRTSIRPATADELREWKDAWPHLSQHFASRPEDTALAIHVRLASDSVSTALQQMGSSQASPLFVAPLALVWCKVSKPGGGARPEDWSPSLLTTVLAAHRAAQAAMSPSALERSEGRMTGVDVAATEQLSSTWTRLNRQMQQLTALSAASAQPTRVQSLASTPASPASSPAQAAASGKTAVARKYSFDNREQAAQDSLSAGNKRPSSTGVPGQLDYGSFGLAEKRSKSALGGSSTYQVSQPNGALATARAHAALAASAASAAQSDDGRPLLADSAAAQLVHPPKAEVGAVAAAMNSNTPPSEAGNTPLSLTGTTPNSQNGATPMSVLSVGGGTGLSLTAQHLARGAGFTRVAAGPPTSRTPSATLSFAAHVPSPPAFITKHADVANVPLAYYAVSPLYSPLALVPPLPNPSRQYIVPSAEKEKEASNPPSPIVPALRAPPTGGYLWASGHDDGPEMMDLEVDTKPCFGDLVHLVRQMWGLADGVEGWSRTSPHVPSGAQEVAALDEGKRVLQQALRHSDYIKPLRTVPDFKMPGFLMAALSRHEIQARPLALAEMASQPMPRLLTPPHVLIQTEQGSLSVTATATKHWRHLGMRPHAAARQVRYVLVTDADLDAETLSRLRLFARETEAAFAGAGLGTLVAACDKYFTVRSADSGDGNVGRSSTAVTPVDMQIADDDAVPDQAGPATWHRSPVPMGHQPPSTGALIVPAHSGANESSSGTPITGRRSTSDPAAAGQLRLERPPSSAAQRQAQANLGHPQPNTQDRVSPSRRSGGEANPRQDKQPAQSQAAGPPSQPLGAVTSAAIADFDQQEAEENFSFASAEAAVVAAASSLDKVASGHVGGENLYLVVLMVMQQEKGLADVELMGADRAGSSTGGVAVVKLPWSRLHGAAAADTHATALACFLSAQPASRKSRARRPAILLAPTENDEQKLESVGCQLRFKPKTHLLHCAFVLPHSIVAPVLTAVFTDGHGDLWQSLQLDLSPWLVTTAAAGGESGLPLAAVSKELTAVAVRMLWRRCQHIVRKTGLLWHLVLASARDLTSSEVEAFEDICQSTQTEAESRGAFPLSVTLLSTYVAPEAPLLACEPGEQPATYPLASCMVLSQPDRAGLQLAPTEPMATERVAAYCCSWLPDTSDSSQKPARPVRPSPAAELPVGRQLGVRLAILWRIHLPDQLRRPDAPRDHALDSATSDSDAADFLAAHFYSLSFLNPWVPRGDAAALPKLKAPTNAVPSVQHIVSAVTLLPSHVRSVVDSVRGRSGLVL